MVTEHSPPSQGVAKHKAFQGFYNLSCVPTSISFDQYSSSDTAREDGPWKTFLSMAEAFGIAAGAVGIAAIFSTCVECFDYIQAGRRFGVDFQTQLLTLSLLQLRLSRWGESVHVYDDPQLRRPAATAAELDLAKNTLFQILVLLEASAKITVRYQSKSTSGKNSTGLTYSDLEPISGTLYSKIRALTTKRQKESSLLKLATWALYHKDQYTELVEGITRLLDNLEQTFPGPEARNELVAADLEELSQGTQDYREGALTILQKISSEVDNSIQIRATEEAAKSGVFIGAMVLQGNVRVRDGNFYSTSWKGETGVPGGSTIRIGAIYADGNARIANGDSYSERDNFLLDP